MASIGLIGRGVSMRADDCRVFSMQGIKEGKEASRAGVPKIALGHGPLFRGKVFLSQ